MTTHTIPYIVGLSLPARTAQERAIMTRPKFSVGDRVADKETTTLGTVVHLFEAPELKDEILVVKFDNDIDPSTRCT